MVHVFSENWALNSLAKKFKNYVANQSGKDGNPKISNRENIFHGESQTLALAVDLSKLAHQQV